MPVLTTFYLPERCFTSLRRIPKWKKESHKWSLVQNLIFITSLIITLVGLAEHILRCWSAVKMSECEKYEMLGVTEIRRNTKLAGGQSFDWWEAEAVQQRRKLGLAARRRFFFNWRSSVFILSILYLNPPTNQINLPQLIRSHKKQ